MLGFLSLLSVAAITPVSAYEVVEVEHGGAVTGKVTLEGQPIPTSQGFNLVTFPDPEYCGRISNGSGWRLLHDFSTDQAGGLKDVVVTLEGIEKGRPFDVSVPRVEARDCQFQPFVAVVRNGHAVEVVNMDPVMHDVQAYETSLHLGPRVLFNSPLPMNAHHQRGNIHATHRHLPGPSMLEPINLTKSRNLFVMQCGFHAYMLSWGLAVSNPYYAITDGSGSYTIENVPPGSYRMMAWHPYIGTMSEEIVAVKPDGRVEVHFSMKAPAGRRTSHQVMDNPRFGLESLGRPLHIEPLVEHQH
ncbi:MAG: carboxypeptidase regulatory-like domain-containing protein [Nitrospirae bacterium]|nr:carboxypeptidase regulatory-like domain-containing protein [Nitrospirota bacterium]